MKTGRQYVTAEQLAELYQLPVKRIYTLVERGKLVPKRLPGSRLLRFDLDELEGKGAAPGANVVDFTKAKRRA
jgi:phage terminase Nu1 subunit (DNA packaging protein)